MPDKGKGRMVEPPHERAPKRRRVTTDLEPESGEEEEEEHDEGSDNEDQVEEVAHAQRIPAARSREATDARRSGTARFYDQAQDEGERRELKQKARRLEREFTENRDEYLKSGNDGLTKTIEEADSIFAAVKQTADATTDARLMVSVSDIAHRKTTKLTLSDTATGIDVDEFVSKCISFMRRSSTQLRQTQLAEDEEVDEGYLDWAQLGSQGCFPYNIRPGVPNFLLGPLSVQKRARAATQRRARLRDDGRPEVAPEQLAQADLAPGQAATVRDFCNKIKQRLEEHSTQAMAAVEAEHAEMTERNGRDPTEEEVNALMRRHRVTYASGPILFDFAINPHSFGQTVENLFYISFLIKEGEVGLDVEADPDGFPAVVVNKESVTEARSRKSTRHQAVFGLDYQTWQDLIEAFSITTPLIPHRAKEASSVGAKGWYT